MITPLNSLNTLCNDNSYFAWEKGAECFEHRKEEILDILSHLL